MAETVGPAVGIGTAAGIGVNAAIPVALNCAGFTAAGPAAGSFAASWMARYLTSNHGRLSSIV